MGKLIVILISVIWLAQSDIFAVITVGSEGWSNYRHQADGCRAYQILRKGGIKKENIVMLSYDDIPNASENPLKGSLYSKYGDNYFEVRKTCEIDYKSTDVTKENFKNVLLGNEQEMIGIGTGRVLKSTDQDMVFLFYEDHGNEGIISFPSKSYLFVDELQALLKEMFSKRKFKKLAFFINACFSGSMWEEKYIENLYSITAAHPYQSAYAIYRPPHKIEGRTLTAFLSSEYAARWMDDVEYNDTSKKTLYDHFLHVRSQTIESEVCQWSDTFFARETKLSEFVGRCITSSFDEAKDSIPLKYDDGVYEEDSYLYTLQLAAQEDAQDRSIGIKLNRELDQRKFVDITLGYLGEKYQINLKNPDEMAGTDMKCYKDLVSLWDEKCSSIGEYGMKVFKLFRRFCKRQSQQKENLIADIQKLC